jgi:hypothetical protein
MNLGFGFRYTAGACAALFTLSCVDDSSPADELVAEEGRDAGGSPAAEDAAATNADAGEGTNSEVANDSGGAAIDASGVSVTLPGAETDAASTSDASIQTDADAPDASSADGESDAANVATDAAPTADAAVPTLDAALGRIDAAAASGDCMGPGPENPTGLAGFPTAPTFVVEAEGPWLGWSVNYGTLQVQVEAEREVLYLNAPGDSRTSYLMAPSELLGDLTSKSNIVFEFRTTGSGGYYDSGYGYLGDLVIQGEAGNAYAQVEFVFDEAWHTYVVPLSTCWSVDQPTLAAILENVTGLGIRAEFTTGSDAAWLGSFTIE